MTLANVTINTLLMNAINKSGQFILACTSTRGKGSPNCRTWPVGGFLLFKQPTAFIAVTCNFSLTVTSHNLPASVVFCVHPRTSCKISWAQPKRDQRCAISARWPKLKSLDLRLCTLPPFIIRISFCLSLPLRGVQGRFNLLLTCSHSFLLSLNLLQLFIFYL